MTHPRPTPWDTIFTSLSQILNVPLVSFAEWMKRVVAHGQSQQDPRQAAHDVPALRLLEFFKGFGSAGFAKICSFEDLGTTLAEQVSPTLRQMDVLGEKDVKNLVDYWRRAGVLPQPAA